MGPRGVSNIIISSLASLLCVAIAGCGSDVSGFDPNESEASRAIREKVRLRMEDERLERYAPRIAFAAAAAAASPTATAGRFAATGGDEEAEPEGERGSALYQQNCASCHGPRGGGDGPVGASLNPQPAKHHDGGYMNALSNEHIFKVIKEGGAAIGKSPTMAPWGATMSDDQILDVVAFIRALAEPPYTGPEP